MKDYAIYYSYKNIGDVLIILFDKNKEVTSYEKKNNVVVIYHNDGVIGYNIFDVKEIIKIKNEGMIYYPSNALIDVINTMLKNAKVETLEYKEESGYVTAEVIDVIPLDEHKSYVIVGLENDSVNLIAKDVTVNVGDKVVIAKVGTYLNNGDVVKEGNMDGTLLNGHLCTNGELGINEDKEQVLVLDKDIEVGKDFFSMEEK